MIIINKKVGSFSLALQPSSCTIRDDNDGEYLFFLLVFMDWFTAGGCIVFLREIFLFFVICDSISQSEKLIGGEGGRPLEDSVT